MRLAALSTLILSIAAALQVAASEDRARHAPGSTAAALLTSSLSKLAASLHRLHEQASTSEDRLSVSRLSELLQSFQFRLMNGRVVEKSPRQLLGELLARVRLTLPRKISGNFEEILRKLHAESPDVWSMPSSDIQDDCPNTPTAPEVALDELTNRCTVGGDYHDVLGCLGAVTLYCHKIFPDKSSSELLGLVTDRKGNALSIACLDRSGLIFASDWNLFNQHCRHGCEQTGADRVCQLHHGSEFGGVFAHRVTLRSLGQNADDNFMAGCFRAAKRLPVDYSKMQTASNKDCRAGNPVNNYGCLKAASSYCKDHFGYTGGVVQYWEPQQTAEVACYHAFYTGEAYISRGADFIEAKNSLKKICSLDFDIDKGKILATTPELLSSGEYDNRRSSVELRDIFSVSKSVTTENQFSHSHSMSIGLEVTKKAMIPFIAEAKVTVSTSYTATIGLSKTNSKTTQFAHTSEVFVPPGMGVVKRAVITRTKLDVPWRAVGISGLGKRVEISGTWSGVDVSDIRVEQVDL